jgi:hypothetical protein
MGDGMAMAHSQFTGFTLLQRGFVVIGTPERLSRCVVLRPASGSGRMDRAFRGCRSLRSLNPRLISGIPPGWLGRDRVGFRGKVFEKVKNLTTDGHR